MPQVLGWVWHPQNKIANTSSLQKQFWRHPFLLSVGQHVDEVWDQPLWLSRGEALQEWQRDRSHDQPRDCLPSIDSFAFFVIFDPLLSSEQRHQWVWEDLESEQGDDHGGCFHQRAHRRLAQEHQNPSTLIKNTYFSQIVTYHRCWSNW